MVWRELSPDEKREVIEAGVADSQSARLIGQSCGATKGQIIGWAYRHGVKLRPKAEKTIPRQRYRPQPKRRRVMRLVSSLPLPQLTEAAPDTALRFLDRRPYRECSYILDALPIEQRMCCGAPIPEGAGFEFCLAHLRVCLQPLPSRRRAA